MNIPTYIKIGLFIQISCIKRPIFTIVHLHVCGDTICHDLFFVSEYAAYAYLVRWAFLQKPTKRVDVTKTKEKNLYPLPPTPWPPWNFKHRPPTPQASVLKMILFLIYGLFTEIKKGKKLLKMCNTIILVFLPEEYYCKWLIIEGGREVTLKVAKIESIFF